MELGSFLSRVWAINLAHIRCSGIVGTRLFTKSFCPPTNFESTFDYYPLFRATAKTDLAGIIRQGKENRKWLFRPQWHEKLCTAYRAETGVLPPFDQRCEHFIEDYNPWHQRRAREMPRQTRMIGADATENFKRHARDVAARSSAATDGLLAPAARDSTALNQIARSTAQMR